jgi:hypothetical protein
MEWRGAGALEEKLRISRAEKMWTQDEKGPFVKIFEALLIKAVSNPN